jgi:hypothetical protein
MREDMAGGSYPETAHRRWPTAAAPGEKGYYQAGEKETLVDLMP